MTPSQLVRSTVFSFNLLSRPSVLTFVAVTLLRPNVCSRLSLILTSPSMPTPSDNQPTSIAEVISTRTCPPEVDRDLAWRDSPDSAGSTSDTIDDVLSPGSAIVPSVLSRSDDGSTLLATDPLKVESKIPVVDDDIAPGRSTSPAVSSDRTQSTVTPPNSSLLRYEFSNVRVRTRPIDPHRATPINWRYSFCQTIPRPFFAPEANSLEHNSQTVRCIMLTWRSSTWTWLSPICAAIYAFKVCPHRSQLIPKPQCLPTLTPSYSSRSHRGPSHSDHVL